MAAPPRPPRQKLDFTGCNVCAPIQRDIGDIPVIHFDAALGVQHYSNVMLKRTNRARGIGPATFYGSAIIPTENPQNRRVDPVTRKKVVGSGASHHIIQICYSAQKKDPNLAVQLLVNDVNGYIMAKRVRRNGVFGAWQQFTDIDGAEVPEFLNAQVMDLPASHDVTSTTIGGSMEEMFYGLVGPVEDKKAARLARRRAIILFCEAFRLRSIYLEMIRRLLHKEVATGLSEQAWPRIGSWKVLSRFLIYLAKYGKKLDAVLASKLALYAKQYGISTFEQLTGELQVLRYSDESLLTNSVKKALAHKKAGMGIEDPKFPRA